MRFYLDTEFFEDGKTIDLISIGVVHRDDRFYAENREFDWNRVPADHWIQHNVRPHLRGGRVFQTDRATIRDDLRDFVNNICARNDSAPEFWAYYGDYDWVVTTQLFGTFADHPTGWPILCMDVMQAALQAGITELPKQKGVEHNALNDALQARAMHEFVEAQADRPSVHRAMSPGMAPFPHVTAAEAEVLVSALKREADVWQSVLDLAKSREVRTAVQIRQMMAWGLHTAAAEAREAASRGVPDGT